MRGTLHPLALLLGVFLVVSACAPPEDVAEDPTDVEPPEELEETDPVEEEPEEEPVEDDGETITVGVLATLEGAFAASGEDGVRGVELAFEEVGSQVAGRDIQVIIESTDGSPEVATDRARKLLEVDRVDYIIGPLSGSEGVALADFMKDYPDHTMINGTSGAQETTFIDPAPNFFRFGGDGVQWQAGLGTYVYEELGYREIVLLAEDYSFPYSQAAGFKIEFCGAGGEIVNDHWVPIGTEDYSSVIAALPDDVDAVYAVLGAAAAINFLTQL
jgi:branched-chain amino acid transport system substrate-binding protein